MASYLSNADPRLKGARRSPKLRVMTSPSSYMAKSTENPPLNARMPSTATESNENGMNRQNKASRDEPIRRVTSIRTASLNRSSSTQASSFLPKSPDRVGTTRTTTPTSAASLRFGFGASKAQMAGNRGAVADSRTMEHHTLSGGLRRKPSIVGQAIGTGRSNNAASKIDTANSMRPTRSDSLRNPVRTLSPGRTLPLASPSELGYLSMSTEIPVPLDADLSINSQSTDFWNLDFAGKHGSPYPPAATSLYALSASPSTRYSGSPGPFSRTSTPTSISSHSPSIIMPIKSASTRRRASPTRSRPPVTKRKAELIPVGDTVIIDPQGLASLRESLTSSSSGSTIKAGERADKGKRKHAFQPPLSPPPRKSSIKFSRTRSEPPGGGADVSQNNLPSAMSPTSLFGDRPSRPSREGTIQLQDIQQRSPVIQSNLTKLQSSNRHRRSSSSSSLNLKSILRRDSVSVDVSNGPPGEAKVESTTTITSPSTALSRDIPSRPSARSSVSSIFDGKQPSDKSRSTSSGTSNKSATRFGFFGLRSKTQSDPKLSEKPTKSSRKGPAAGTGHEGYGKYSLRGRSGSTTSGSGSWTRSTSAESSTSSVMRSTPSRKSSMNSSKDIPLDDFFLERLSPVVITGGGRAFTENKSFEDRRQSVQSSASEGRSASSVTKAADASQQSGTEPFGLTKSRLMLSDTGSLSRPALSSRSMSTETEKSLQSPKTPGMPKLFTVDLSLEPQVVNGKALGHPFPAYEQNSSQSSSSPEGLASKRLGAQENKELPSRILFQEEKEGQWLKPVKPQSTPRLMRKWNFFQRAQVAPPEMDTDEDSIADARDLATRPIAHYAMFDAVEVEGIEDLEDIMHEVEILSGIDSHSVSGQQSQWYKNKAASEQNRQSSAFPPSLSSCSKELNKVQRPISESVKTLEPSALLQEIHPLDGSEVRPSRLPQVGRIPPVISKRDRKRTLPSQSFSRPFAQTNPRPTTPAQARSNQSENSPKKMAQDDVEGRKKEMPARASVVISPSDSSLRENENSLTAAQFPISLPVSDFFSFSPRKNSEVSYSSSSTASYAATTAVVPLSNQPPTEDEIWEEYDDLIDDVLVPKGLGHIISEPAPLGLGLKSTRNAAHTALVSVPAAKSVPHHAQSAFELAPPIDSKRSSPMSFSDLFSGYGERNNSIIEPLNDNPRSSARSGCSSKSGHSKFGSIEADNAPAKPLTQSSCTLVQESNVGQTKPESFANLRFGALMTSRWLSFGRVLFSPAHTELKQNSPNRLLVLDGLGNDDWSFYCALTYPTATIYNLSPTQIDTGASASAAANHEPESGLQSPPNHRQIHHSDISNPFPFPRGFFAAVIIRFPVANSDAALRNAVSESKRVLRPGGYLEFSALDIDMMNMGSLARRAVRMQKVRMQVGDPALSLKSVSDSIQKMLGRRGFENLNRCLLGVPVAGRVADSRSGSFDSAHYSLDDMLRDHSQEGDAGIAKTVAKVGRWWYSRCYETRVLSDADLPSKSLFNDRELLKECEEQGTNFKLFICYAQKPLTPRRRTVSL